jgi:hypothetical protein
MKHEQSNRLWIWCCPSFNRERMPPRETHARRRASWQALQDPSAHAPLKETSYLAMRYRAATRRRSSRRFRGHWRMAARTCSCRPARIAGGCEVNRLPRPLCAAGMALVGAEVLLQAQHRPCAPPNHEMLTVDCRGPTTDRACSNCMGQQPCLQLWPHPTLICAAFVATRAPARGSVHER